MTAAAHLPLVGGPLDSHTIPKQRGRYAWVIGKRGPAQIAIGFACVTVLAYEGKGAGPQPANGRALYELDEAGTCYVYAGHRRTYCNACGCYHGKAEGGREKRPCALDGGES